MQSGYTLINNKVESSSPVGCLNSSLGNGSGYAKSSSFINQKFWLKKKKFGWRKQKFNIAEYFNIAEKFKIAENLTLRNILTLQKLNIVENLTLRKI